MLSLRNGMINHNPQQEIRVFLQYRKVSEDACRRRAKKTARRDRGKIMATEWELKHKQCCMAPCSNRPRQHNGIE